MTVPLTPADLAAIRARWRAYGNPFSRHPDRMVVVDTCNDIARLLDEVERLTAERDKVQSEVFAYAYECRNLRGGIKVATDLQQDAAKENERLREALREIKDDPPGEQQNLDGSWGDCYQCEQKVEIAKAALASGEGTT